VTGPPGAGKSTLIDQLVRQFRHDGNQRRGDGSSAVAVIAVDPTSPFTGGALLGDRLRMGSHAGDRKVFIRSMATRGHGGGLALATGEAILVLDAAGFDTIIVETVGVGQSEVEIISLADVILVVIVPGAGDEIQALKAGIMEIGDIYVVNKADREGADELAATLQAALRMEDKPSRRTEPECRSSLRALSRPSTSTVKAGSSPDAGVTGAPLRSSALPWRRSGGGWMTHSFFRSTASICLKICGRQHRPIIWCGVGWPSS
jgi:LAO/AO transport system ATPase